MRLPLLLTAWLLASGVVAQPDSVRQRLQAQLQPALVRTGIPGYSIAVVQHGRLVWAGGIGIKQAGTTDSVTAETRFQAGSVSKSLTATLALRLARLSLLNLDADVRAGLHTWTLPATRHTQPITPRLLLQHRAGINLDGSWGYPADQPVPTLQQFLDGKGGRSDDPPVRQTAAPGKYRYSTGGYAILEQYLADLLDSDFGTLMQREVFAPLQMTHSDMAQPSPAADWAHGHNAKGRVPAGRSTYPFRAGGGWNTTAADAARWCVAILDAYHGRDTTWLRRSDVAQMLQTWPDNDYSLGWHVEAPGTPALAVYHRGLNRGFMAIVKIYLEADYAVVLLGNDERAADLWPLLTTAIRAQFPPQ